MRHLILALLITTGCGGKKPAADHPPANQPPANQPPADQPPASQPPVGAGSDRIPEHSPPECPDTLDCMPPTNGPCPPAGFTKRCPHTQITY